MSSRFGIADVDLMGVSAVQPASTGGTLRKYMPVETAARAVLRFAAFEVDMHTGELRKHGMRVRLQEQPFKILAMLLERPGELVTREEIKERLWPADTFVDFEHSVNAAIRRLRDALDDHADTPRFVETLPRRGYRFIGEVGHDAEVTPPVMARAAAPTRAIKRFGGSSGFQRVLMIAAVLVIIVVAVPLDWPHTAINSIGVLPFANDTSDPSFDYLADGIPSRLIETLSTARELRVASRNSAFTLRGKNIDTKAAASALHVRALLMGSLKRSGEQLLLTTELIDAENDKHLWGETYAVTPAEVNKLGTIIANAVGERIQQRIPMRPQRAVNPAAYDACIRGDHLMDVRTNESFKQALELFHKATDIDPDYAQAYAAMSKAYGLLAWYGGMPAGEALPLQEAAADRALELEPNNALALINKVAALGNYHRNIQAAAIPLRRAIELAPNDPVVQNVYSIGMSRLGRMDDAIAAAKRAEELDPLWPGYAVLRAQVFYDARRYDDAIRLREQEPSLKSDHTLYAVFFAAAGRRQEALDELAQLRFDERAAPYTFCAAAQAYGRVGEKARGAELLKEGLDRQRRLGTETIQGCTAYDAAAAYASLDARDKMLAALHEADIALDSKLQWIKIDSAFDGFRSDPAFERIVQSEYTPR